MLPILGLLSRTTLPPIVNPAVTIEPKTAPYYVPSEQIPKHTPGAFGRPSNYKRRLAARAASKAAKTHRKMIRAKSR